MANILIGVNILWSCEIGLPGVPVSAVSKVGFVCCRPNCLTIHKIPFGLINHLPKRAASTNILSAAVTIPLLINPSSKFNPNPHLRGFALLFSCIPLNMKGSFAYPIGFHASSRTLNLLYWSSIGELDVYLQANPASNLASPSLFKSDLLTASAYLAVLLKPVSPKNGNPAPPWAPLEDKPIVESNEFILKEFPAVILLYDTTSFPDVEYPVTVAPGGAILPWALFVNLVSVASSLGLYGPGAVLPYQLKSDFKSINPVGFCTGDTAFPALSLKGFWAFVYQLKSDFKSFNAISMFYMY